jgi:hypothetical protein
MPKVIAGQGLSFWATPAKKAFGVKQASLNVSQPPPMMPLLASSQATGPAADCGLYPGG